MKIKDIRLKTVITLAILTYAAVMYAAPGVSCIVLLLTGVRCPGCGMTRALLSALRFDFKTAFEYHIMFWSVPILYAGFLFDGKLFKVKWMNIALYTLIAVGFVINWLFCGKI